MSVNVATREAPAATTSSALNTLVALVAVAAVSIFVGWAPDTMDVVARRPGALIAFLILTLGLQLLAVDVYGRGRIGASGIGVLAAGFAFGAGVAMLASFVLVAVHVAGTRKRPNLHKATFNAAAVSLAGAAGAMTYRFLDGAALAWSEGLVPAFAGGAIFWAVNIGLLTFAMSVAEGASLAAIWKERFRWLTIHYLAFGPLALASVVGYEKMGVTGLLAFSFPPALVIFSVQQYLRRTREAVEEVRRANAALEARNRDLRDLLEFAAGLAARAHDRGELVTYVERSLEGLTGGRIAIADGEHEGIELRSGGDFVAMLVVTEDETFDAERWDRLRDAILPQLATALESAQLVDQVKRTHLATIAALSKSMEAKDYYTGGHTERVSEVAVALARRLGYEGAELQAIEIGALLHDIGKIGIPERILHKPGPLDGEEWRVMKAHPTISDDILSEVDLPAIVRQIARSSHERIDGAGYPDGLAGEAIPLPARIVLVADAFDAITSDRPYRAGRNTEAALRELRAHAGTQFCATVVAELERLYQDEPGLLGPGVSEAA